MTVHDRIAKTVDGIPYSEIVGLPAATVNLLAARGVLFCTEGPDGVYGHVVATGWDLAQDICFGRGLGERVVGKLCEVC